MATGTA